MNDTSDNQNIGYQPIHSPSVSDELLYELGILISASTEEEDVEDTPSTKIDQQLQLSSISNKDCFNADVKKTSESENSSVEKTNCVVSESPIQQFDGIDFQIGIESSSVSSCSGSRHKQKDKKYLRKIKKRKRRKKGVTCSPTKLEAICREMSGLVVSEDDASAPETSPESVESEDGALQEEELKTVSSENHENLTGNQDSDDNLEEDQRGKGQINSNEIHPESTRGAQRSGNHITRLFENDENSSKEDIVEVVQERNASESIHEIHPSDSLSHMCSEITFEDIPNVKESTATDLKKMGNDKSNDITVFSCINENTEKGRQIQEKAESSEGKEEDLRSSSRNSSQNNNDENLRNSSAIVTSDFKDDSFSKENSFKGLHETMKKFSIRVRRLSEESIAVYTGNSPTKSTAANEPCRVSPSSSTLDLPDLDKPFTQNDFPSAQIETGVNESRKILDYKQNAAIFSPNELHENVSLKTFSIRVRRLSGDTIASYTSSATCTSPVKSKNMERNLFKAPKSPLNLKSTSRRSTRQPSNSGQKIKESPVKKTNSKARTPSCQLKGYDLKGDESSRSRRARSKEQQSEKEVWMRGKGSNSGMLESASEVNFRHKSNPRASKTQMQRMRGVVKTLDFSEKLNKVSGNSLFAQIKDCTVNIRKIDFDACFVKPMEKQRTSCNSDIFKIPLAPVMHEGRRRSGRNSNGYSSSSTARNFIKDSRAGKMQSRLELETMSEVHIPRNLTRVQSRQRKLLDNSSEVELLNTPNKRNNRNDTVRSDDSKGRSTRSLRQRTSNRNIQNGKRNECLNSGMEIERKRRRNDSCHESLQSSQASPVKMCSVRVRRLSGDTIASYTNRESKMPGLFDDIVKNLTKRSENNSISNDAIHKIGEINSVSSFVVPSVPVRKRKKSGDTVSSLSKWSTRRQALKTKNTRHTPKRNWLDTDSTDSESTIRPCSVKLSRMDPDSVSHCGHNWKQGEISMPNHIHNPALNVNNLDKVVDDELYCLRRFLQVPVVAESKPSTSEAKGKQEVPKVKACSVILKRITKKRNFESVNIKKVIAKQLADNVEFSSGSESAHEEEEDFDINKLLFSLKESDGKVKERMQEPVILPKNPGDKTSEISVELNVTNGSEEEKDNFEGFVDPQTGEIIKNISSPDDDDDDDDGDNIIEPDKEIGKMTAKFTERSEGKPLFKSTFVEITSSQKMDEESLKEKESCGHIESFVKQVINGEGNDSIETVPIINEEINSCTEKSDENAALDEEVLEKLLPPIRKPESDIWSDDLPDIEVDDTIRRASEDDPLKTLSCISVYSDTNSSRQEDAGENGHRNVELCQDYFQLANKTKDCSVRLQRIDARLNS